MLKQSVEQATYTASPPTASAHGVRNRPAPGTPRPSPAGTRNRPPNEPRVIPWSAGEGKRNVREKSASPACRIGVHARPSAHPGVRMTALPIADWLAALAGMETALGAAVDALDRYQAGWAGVLAESPPGAGAAADRAAQAEDRLRGWDDRLAAAADQAAAVERQLDEPSAAVARWQRLFAGWRDLVQRGVDPTPPAADPPAPLPGE